MFRNVSNIMGGLYPILPQKSGFALKIYQNPLTQALSQRMISHLGNSPIAQSVEQMTVNHWVTGSSPVRGAN